MCPSVVMVAVSVARLTCAPTTPRGGFWRPFDPADASRTGHAVDRQTNGLSGGHRRPLGTVPVLHEGSRDGKVKPCEVYFGTP